MTLEDNKYYKFYKKNEKFIHFLEGIAIIFLISMTWISLSRSNQLQSEISENCGWGEEDYECYCKKDEAIAIRDELKGNEINFDLSNVDS